MNVLKTVLKSSCNKVEGTTASKKSTTNASARRSRAVGGLRFVALTAAALLAAAGLPQSSAQTAPPYVVYSQTGLTTTAQAPKLASFGGFRGHAAANSRGDFFVSDNAGHVIEYPANGGQGQIVWTDSTSNGNAGVAVDPSDNLFIGNFTYNGPSGPNDQNSLLYEFPSTNGVYQGLPYTFNQNQPPGSCLPPTAAGVVPAVLANTTVCAVGFFQGAIYYYWQGPFDTAVDGQGNNYTISGYTSHDNGTALTIFQCQIYCAEQIPGNGASTYTGSLPSSVQSLAANYKGDLYFADDKSVYLIPANSPTTSNVPTSFDSSYSVPYGVSFDPSGNLYVSDSVGIWEVPALEAGGAPCKGGTDVCTITASSKYLLLPVTSGSNPPGLYSSYLAPAIDNRGNIVFSPGYGNLVKYSLWAGSFPAAQIGATGSAPITFTVSFDQATTIGSLTVIQGSSPATEFAVTPGTCTTGSAFKALTTCTFTATFTPTGLGVRTAAVILTDSTGKSTYTYLSGTGNGTGVTVDPGTPTQIASGFKKPAGVTVDGAGNTYVADSLANKVQEFPAGGGAAISIGTALNVPTGVAVDAGGNVYIVNQGTGATGGSVVEVPSVAGVLTNSAQKTLVSGLNLPTDIIVDPNANLYITATGGSQVLQLANASRDNASAALVSRGFGLNAPTGLAMDVSGNLYVADTGNNRVLQLADGSQVSVGSGLSAPTGVATDPSGAVIIADGSGRILRVPNETFGTNAIGLNTFDQQVLESPLSHPYSIRSDNSGNLYVSDNVALVVDQLQRTTGVVNFGPWNLNTVSDAQEIILSNIGTADITIGNPAFAAVPASSGFAVAAGTGTSACGSGLFHSGYQCTVLASFTPTKAGQVTYPLVFNAPATNTAAPTVNLIGTGVSEGAATIKLTQTSPTTSTISYGQVVTFTATVTATNSPTAPTGFVTFIFNGQDQPPVKLTQVGSTAVATAPITFTGLNAGSNTLSVFYEGDANYASLDSATVPVVIQQATSSDLFTVVGDSAVPLSVQPTDNISFTAVLTPAVAGLFTGTVNFIDLTHNVAINLQPIVLGQPDKNGITYTVSVSLPANNLPSFSGTGVSPLNYNVVAVYSGNSNYLPNTSVVIPFTVVNKGYTITQDVTSVIATKTVPGIVNLVVTDYSNFQGNVSLQCAGLPANAYCVFRPASAQLLPAVSTVLQNTQLTPLTIYPVPVVLQIVVDQNPAIIAGSIYWFAALVLGLGLAFRRKLTAGKFGLSSLLAVLSIAGLASLSGCGSGTSNPFPTPTGTYAVTITGTATPNNADGTIPPCSFVNCNLPYDPVNNPSINLVRTVNVSVTVK